MRILWIKIGENPTVENIPHKLEYMQELVGGMIEIVEPFQDDVVLVCNENALSDNKPINRTINDQINIRGDFFLCGQDSIGLCDIPKDKIKLYTQKFQIN